MSFFNFFKNFCFHKYKFLKTEKKCYVNRSSEIFYTTVLVYECEKCGKCLSLVHNGDLYDVVDF